MSRPRKSPPGVDPKLLIKDAAKLLPQSSRRKFLRGAASLGALSMLTGCDIVDGPTSENVLRVISHFNDWVQALLFSPTRRWRRNIRKARSPGRSRSTPIIRADEAPDIDGDNWQLEIGGLVDNKKPWTLAELNTLPEVSQITRHVCVEGWSAIGSWQGVRLSDFLKLIGADTTAKYVWFQCAEGYSTTIDMPTALHPQTQIDAQIRSPDPAAAYGFPIKIRIPTKLGFKNPKYVTAMWVQNNDAGGYWENQGYNWFSGQ